MVGTTPGLKKEEGKKGLLTDMVKQIVAEEWYSGWLTDRNILDISLELVSKELNHFGVIADLFRQIGGHSSRFVLFFSF